MKLSFKILLVSTALISFAGATAGFIAIVLAYEAPASADKPNVTDWMQGWGNVGGVVVGAGAAFAAALVYRQGQRALQDAEKRRLEDLADAAEAAKQAETRWKFERAAAEEAHDETVARMEKQIQGAERAARAMQSQFQLDRHRWIAEQEERRLEVARAVLVWHTSSRAFGFKSGTTDTSRLGAWQPVCTFWERTSKFFSGSPQSAQIRKLYLRSSLGAAQSEWENRCYRIGDSTSRTTSTP
jgi:hypothetical protein